MYNFFSKSIINVLTLTLLKEVFKFCRCQLRIFADGICHSCFHAIKAAKIFFKNCPAIATSIKIHYNSMIEKRGIWGGISFLTSHKNNISNRIYCPNVVHGDSNFTLQRNQKIVESKTRINVPAIGGNEIINFCWVMLFNCVNCKMNELVDFRWVYAVEEVNINCFLRIGHLRSPSF
jgi:hypothetical protein